MLNLVGIKRIYQHVVDQLRFILIKLALTDRGRESFNFQMDNPFSVFEIERSLSY